MIRAMWEEVKLSFRRPALWEQHWWSDDCVQTAYWIAAPLAFGTFFGLACLMPSPQGAGVFLVLVPAVIVYTLTLLGVAAYLRAN